jgi:hypothetical protein
MTYAAVLRGRWSAAEASASVLILFAVARARAGGDVDEGGRRAIRLVAGASGVSGSIAPAAIDVDAALARLTSAEARCLTLRAATAIAALGGGIDPTNAVLAKVRAALDEDGVDVAGEERGSTRRMARMRGELDAETDRFVREIGHASEGHALSAQTYEALVRDLEQRKREVVAHALASQLPPPRTTG